MVRWEETETDRPELLSEVLSEVYYGTDTEIMEEGQRSFQDPVTPSASRISRQLSPNGFGQPRSPEGQYEGEAKYDRMRDKEKPPLSSQPNPLETTSLLSELFMSWMDPLLYQGHKRPLMEEDVWPVAKDQQVARLHEVFRPKWEEILKNPHKANWSEGMKLLWTMVRAFKKNFIISGVWYTVHIVSTLIQPFFIRSILRLLEGAPDSAFMGISNGYALAVALFITSILTGIDSERVWQAFVLLHWAWVSPVMLVVAMVLFVKQLGVSSLAGTGLIAIVLATQFFIGHGIGKCRHRVMKHTGERVNFLSEVLQGIRVVKFYAWEAPLCEKVLGIRREELRHLKSFHFLRTLNAVVLFVAPVLVATVTFISYAYTEGDLAASTVFTAMSFLSLLRRPLTAFPMTVTSLAEGYISLRRLGSYLIAEELQSNGVAFAEEQGTDRTEDGQERQSQDSASSTESAVVVKDGEFHWSKGRDELNVVPEDILHSSSFTLKNVSFQVKTGHLVIVVGDVGSGKSSLIAAILGFMHKTKGTCRTNGSIAFMSQETWIRNCSIKDNILFELPYDPVQYVKVIRAAQLLPDLRVLPNGDLTEVGERGINLSGGQKARISLARALYRLSHAKIFILDDPLSAVDATSASKIFQDCILGYLAGTTRILVLNSHYQFLEKADELVIMEHGEIVGYGPPDQLRDNFPKYFETMGDEDAAGNGGSPVLEEEIPQGQEMKAIRSLREFPLRSMEERILSAHAKEDQGLTKKLMEKEEREIGSVTWKTYVEYFAASGRNGIPLLVAVIVFFLAGQVGRNANDWWLATWTVDQFSLSKSDYSWVYVGTAVFTTVTALLRSFLLVLACLLSSGTLHDDLLSSVLAAPINLFYDVTPMGRIMNRFSKDIDHVDSFLPDYLNTFFQNLLFVIGIVIVCAFSSFYILLLYIPVFVVFYIIQNFFLSSSRELKRLENITRSPVFSSFAETLTGLSTIRAFGMEDMFLRKNYEAIDHNSRFFSIYWYTSRWLGLRLDLVATLLVFIIALFAVITADTVNPGLAGLALSYVLQLTGMVQFLVRTYVQLETTMTSTERILFYKNNCKAEGQATTDEDKQLPESWPSKGCIELRDVRLRYRPELPLVLNGISLRIEPRDKVGICGRTGSGKSSLMMALLRIVETESGTIFIDGVDISRVGLHRLRSRLSMIPQDPVLFSGSVRYNLDPFNEHADDRLWLVLERVHLRKYVEQLPAKLDFVVSEGGENLSIGQRQLLCIGRALVKQSQILLSDEATASVDSSTDALVQETIRRNFADRTVLTIAHRLDTIIESTKVAVLGNGQLLEYDTPQQLLKDPTSEFSQLVNELGHGFSEAMAKRAAGTKMLDEPSAEVA